jgi:hypothetical protein
VRIVEIEGFADVLPRIFHIVLAWVRINEIEWVKTYDVRLSDIVGAALMIADFQETPSGVLTSVRQSVMRIRRVTNFTIESTVLAAKIRETVLRFRIYGFFASFFDRIRWYHTPGFTN